MMHSSHSNCQKTLAAKFR